MGSESPVKMLFPPTNMVVANPLFTHWTVNKFKSTVMYAIWREVVFFSAIATIVSLVSDLTPHKLSVSNTMLTVLGIVLGLVISFRTSSAYERYMEGSKLWTTVKVCSRNLAQIIWIHVPFERKDVNTGQQLKSELKIAIEKKSMINLVQAVPVAIKHLLRREHGAHYEDLYPLVRFLPHYSVDLDQDAPRDHAAFKNHCTSLSSSHICSGPRNALDMLSEDRIDCTLREIRRSDTAPEKARHSDPELALSATDSAHPLQSACNPSKSIFSSLDFWRHKRSLPQIPTSTTGTTGRTRFTSRRCLKREPAPVDTNVPLEITLCLSNYLAWLLKQNQLQPSVATAFMGAITTLQDTVTNLDRITDTPLPFAYQVHLRMSLWLYLFFLPFQVWSSLGYLTIPGTAFVSFLLLGFLEIGHEIENPFDYDLNDLDLDAFCLTIQREVNEIIAHPCPDPDQFLFTSWNRPFAPSDMRTAEEIMNSIDGVNRGPDGGMHAIRRTLLKNWWDVSQATTPAAA